MKHLFTIMVISAVVFSSACGMTEDATGDFESQSSRKKPTKDLLGWGSCSATVLNHVGNYYRGHNLANVGQVAIHKGTAVVDGQEKSSDDMNVIYPLVGDNAFSSIQTTPGSVAIAHIQLEDIGAQATTSPSKYIILYDNDAVILRYTELQPTSSTTLPNTTFQCALITADNMFDAQTPSGIRNTVTMNGYDVNFN